MGLESRVKKILEASPENVSGTLLDMLVITECVLDGEDVKQLLPEDKYKELLKTFNMKARTLKEDERQELPEVDQELDENVSNDGSCDISNKRFRIHKDMDGKYQIIKDKDYSIQRSLVVLTARELEEKAVRKASADAITKQLASRLPGARGRYSKKILNIGKGMLGRYSRMEKNEMCILSELGRLDEMSSEEAKELILAIMVMVQPVLIPDENRPEAYREIFSNDKEYLIDRTPEGKYFFHDTKSPDIVYPLNADKLKLDKSLPIFIDAMRQHAKKGEIPATTYLTVAGVQNVLAAAVPALEKYREQRRKLTLDDIGNAAALLAQDPDVVEQAEDAIVVVDKLKDPQARDEVINKDEL